MIRFCIYFLLPLLIWSTAASSAEKADGIDQILVFGASGRIGQHIVDEALLRGYSVTGVTRDPSRLAEDADKIAVVSADILDRGRVRELVEQHDALIVSVGGSPSDPDPANYIAATAAESLIEVLGEIDEGGPRLIFVGNLFTLDYEDGQSLLDLGRVTEEHHNHAMFYGHEIALELFRAADDVNWTIATPPNGLRLEGRTGNVRWGGNTLLRDPDGRPSEISPEDFAYAIFEELVHRRYIKARFNVAR